MIGLTKISINKSKIKKIKINKKRLKKVLNKKNQMIKISNRKIKVIIKFINRIRYFERQRKVELN